MILWLIFFLWLVSKTQSAPDEEKLCQTGWKYYRPERRCVTFTGRNEIWYQSRTTCDGRRGFLMTVKDKRKTDWVKDNFRTIESIHIGISKHAGEDWKWTDGTTVLKSQENWADPSFSGYRSDMTKCGWVEDVQGTFEWEVEDCHRTTHHYFCEASLTCYRGNGGCGEHRCETRDSVAKCVCNEGFVNDEDGNCVADVKCSVNNGECGNHTTCQDVGIAKVNCSCMAGYNTTAEGDCVAVNPCDVDNGGCQDQETCQMTGPGDRKCVKDDEGDKDESNWLLWIILFLILLIIAAVLIICCRKRKNDDDEKTEEKKPESEEKVPEDQPKDENQDGFGNSGDEDHDNHNDEKEDYDGQ